MSYSIEWGYPNATHDVHDPLDVTLNTEQALAIRILDGSNDASDLGIEEWLLLAEGADTVIDTARAKIAKADAKTNGTGTAHFTVIGHEVFKCQLRVKVAGSELHLYLHLSFVAAKKV